jgi:hypothetical protein
MNPALLLLLVLPAQRPLHANLDQLMTPVAAKLEAGDAQILVIGDSLSRKGWTQPFRDDLQEIWGNAGSGYQGLNWHNDGGFNGGVWDVHNIVEDREPHSGLDGLWAQTTAGTPATGTANSAVLTPWQLGPFDLHYVAQPGGGRFNLFQDTPTGRELLTTIDTAGDTAQVIQWQGVAEGRLVFQPLDQGQPIKILGIVGQSEQTGVRVDRAAVDGWSTVNFAQRDGTFDEQVKLLGTDLAIIALGANEASAALSVGYRDRLETIADRLLVDNPEMQILLMPAYQFNGNAVLSKMTDDALALAQDRGFGFINLYDSAGTTAFFEVNEFLRDSIHWNDAGSAYIADLVLEALRTNGASLDTPSGDVTGDGKVDLSDFGVLKQHFGLTGVKMSQGDLSRDAKVDLSDFGLLKESFGKPANAARVVPEPTSFVLAWLAIPALFVARLAFRRRR